MSLLRKVSVFALTGVAGAAVGWQKHDQIDFAISTTKLKFLPPVDYLKTPQSFMTKAIETTNNLKFAVLSTMNNERGIASRAIQPFPVECDEDGNLCIFFNTNKLSRKYKEMLDRPEVTLSYLDQQRLTCVVYTGLVERIPYPQSTNHWESWLYMFYPEGNDEENGSRFSTWCVRVHRISMISYTEGICSHRNDSKGPEVILDQNENKWIFYCDGKEDK